MPTENTKTEEKSGQKTEDSTGSVESSTKEEQGGQVDQKTPETNGSKQSVEEVAKKIGWNPNHEGEGTVDASTFIINSREINSNLHKKMRHMKQQMDEMSKSVQIIAENAKKNTEIKVSKLQNEIKRLEKERIKAVEDGDTGRFNQVDEEIKNLNNQAVEHQKEPVQNQPSPEYQEWIKENSWYESNPDMRKWAETFYENTPAVKAMPNKMVFKVIAQEARKYFPEKFEMQKPKTSSTEKPKTNSAPKAQEVASPSRRTTHKKTYSFDDFSYEQKKTAEKMVNQLKGTAAEMSLDEYAQEYFKTFGEDK